MFYDLNIYDSSFFERVTFLLWSQKISFHNAEN